MIAALLLRYWRESLIALLALTLAGVIAGQVHAHNARLVETGRLAERARVADSTLAALRPQLARAETVFVHDTVRITRWIARTDTLRDTVLAHITDTLLVKQYVHAADSTIKACSLVVMDCATYRQKAQATIAAQASKITALEARPERSCAGAFWAGVAVGGTAGGTAGNYLGRRGRP